MTGHPDDLEVLCQTHGLLIGLTGRGDCGQSPLLGIFHRTQQLETVFSAFDTWNTQQSLDEFLESPSGTANTLCTSAAAGTGNALEILTRALNRPNIEAYLGAVDELWQTVTWKYNNTIQHTNPYDSYRRSEPKLEAIATAFPNPEPAPAIRDPSAPTDWLLRTCTLHDLCLASWTRPNGTPITAIAPWNIDINMLIIYSQDDGLWERIRPMIGPSMLILEQPWTVAMPALHRQLAGHGHKSVPRYKKALRLCHGALNYEVAYSRSAQNEADWLADPAGMQATFQGLLLEFAAV